MMDRRHFLKAGVGGMLLPRLALSQSSYVTKLTDALSLINAGTNVLSLSTNDGVILVDTGTPQSSVALKAALPVPVRTVFNTHYHLENTASNEVFAQAGAKLIAHERTRQWMSTDYWVPGEERFERARDKMARPTEVFKTSGSLQANAEQIEYGYLPLAHTSCDIYVFFKTANVLAAGDVAAPARDPALDYFTGAWIGGRVEAMDIILKLADEQTRIVPGYGPVMTRAEFKAERDMMEEVRARLWKQVREGLGPKEMLDNGLLNGLPRTWKDPYKFLYDAAKGMWAHHSKLDPNVV
jgi:glyoxylase-like metal-dependent hydrolase (beta-lactamase superfamily II)